LQLWSLCGWDDVPPLALARAMMHAPRPAKLLPADHEASFLDWGAIIHANFKFGGVTDMQILFFF
jgi:hypothetical protein